MTLELIFIFYTWCILALALEIYIIDFSYWKKKKSDKPGSTLIYSLITAILLLLSFWLGFWLTSLYAVLVGISCRALFDPWLNLSRKLPSGKRNICYHSDRVIPLKKWNLPIWKEMNLKEKLTYRVEYYSMLFSYFYEGFWKKRPCWLELGMRAIWFSIGLLVYILGNGENL